VVLLLMEFALLPELLLPQPSVLSALIDVKNVVAQHVETATEQPENAFAREDTQEVHAQTATEESEQPDTKFQNQLPIA